MSGRISTQVDVGRIAGQSGAVEWGRTSNDGYNDFPNVEKEGRAFMSNLIV